MHVKFIKNVSSKYKQFQEYNVWKCGSYFMLIWLCTVWIRFCIRQVRFGSFSAVHSCNKHLPCISLLKVLFLFSFSFTSQKAPLVFLCIDQWSARCCLLPVNLLIFLGSLRSSLGVCEQRSSDMWWVLWCSPQSGSPQLTSAAFVKHTLATHPATGELNS